MQHVSEFIGYLQHEKRYSTHTVQAYQRDLEQFFLYLHVNYEATEPAEISHIHVRSWLASLRENEIEARSINRKISSLKTFFKYLLKKGFVKASPMAKIISPKNTRNLMKIAQTREKMPKSCENRPNSYHDEKALNSLYFTNRY